MFIGEVFYNFAKDKYRDKVLENSGYLCEDRITYMFKTIDDKLHTLIYDLNKMAIEEIE